MKFLIKHRAMLLALIFGAFFPLMVTKCQAAAPEWHMVNVNKHGQGDAHLLIDNGVASLVDLGEYGQAANTLAPYIESMNINHIEHVYISHPHRDHYGGLDALADKGITIGHIYYNMPDDMPDDWDFKRAEFVASMNRCKSMGAELHNVKKGHKVTLSTSKFTVIHAQKSRRVNGANIDTNDYSLIIQWDAGNGSEPFRTIFTGDLNEIVGAELSSLDFVKADILKMPHHGVTGIAPNSFFDKVDPALVMIPSTHALWGHHRGARAKSWTINKGVRYCNNGLNGNIKLKFGEKISITSQTPTAACPNGQLPSKPGEKINMQSNLSFLPAVYMLLEVGFFATPPDCEFTMPAGMVEGCESE